MKIASLLPSCTEIAYVLGLSGQIVGVSHECDFPEEVKNKPILTKSKINPAGRSDEIDKEVINIVKQGLSVYDIYEDKLRELNPDVILTQDQCEVCAVSLKDVQEATNKHICDARIVSLKPEVLNDILNDIYTIGKATYKEREAEELVKNLQYRIDYIRDKTRNLSYMPKICCIEWISPLMVAGNWVPEMIEIAGGKNMKGEMGKHSQKITLDKVLENQPDKIIIAPCGFKINQTIKDMHLLTSNSLWSELNTVKNSEVYIVDGNAYFNRPSQRIIDSLEICFNNSSRIFLRNGICKIFKLTQKPLNLLIFFN